MAINPIILDRRDDEAFQLSNYPAARTKSISDYLINCLNRKTFSNMIAYKTNHYSTRDN